MPTYEYACEKCGHQFDKFQSMSDKPLTRCPSDLCPQKPWGRGKVKKSISAGAGLIFKGSGFYITDYRSEKYKEAAKKDSAAATPAASESKSSNSNQSKGESKPAAVKESKSSGPASKS
jgi:putative FmdB family regulatory protein